MLNNERSPSCGTNDYVLRRSRLRWRGCRRTGLPTKRHQNNSVLARLVILTDVTSGISAQSEASPSDRLRRGTSTGASRQVPSGTEGTRDPASPSISLISTRGHLVKTTCSPMMTGSRLTRAITRAICRPVTRATFQQILTRAAIHAPITRGISVQLPVSKS